MYGWRARIGHILPAAPLDDAIYEFNQMLPEGVIMSYTSLHIQYLRQEDFDRALNMLEEAARIMVEGEVDCIVCGGGPVVTRIGDDNAILDCIRQVTPVPAITSASAAIQAMKRLDMGRVVVASPYDEERNRLLAEFLGKQGIEVVAAEGLGIRRAMDIAKLPFHASYRLARDAWRQAHKADGIYMPCTRLPVVGNIDTLESDLGCPVVTSAQSMVWWALNTLRIAPEGRFGKLMHTLRNLPE